MNKHKEIKAGIIVFIAIFSFILILNLFKGNNFFNSGKYIYAVYNNIGGLEVSRPVSINGLNIGRVDKIYFHPDNSGRLIVKMKINTDLNFSVKTIAMINKNGLIDNPMINLILSNKGRKIKNGDTIFGDIKFSIFSDINKYDDIKSIKNNIQEILINMNILLKHINNILIKEKKIHFIDKINNTFNSIKICTDVVTHAAYRFIDINNILDQIILKNKYNLISSIENIYLLTLKMKKININKTFTELDKCLIILKKIANDLYKKENSLVNIINDDKKIYNYLLNSLNEFDLLLKDIKTNPKKYIHFSLFEK